MTPETKAILDSVEALDKAATEGPWEVDNWETTVSEVNTSDPVCVVTLKKYNNAPLIAEYRNLTPKLARAFRELLDFTTLVSEASVIGEWDGIRCIPAAYIQDAKDALAAIAAELEEKP